MQGQETAAGRAETVDRLEAAIARFFAPRPTPLTARDEELLRQGAGLPLACGLAATAWGEGPMVLLAHGWESRRTHWGAFIPPLVEAGFRAVAVDAPAHGDSPGERTNVVDYGRALLRVGREIGPLAAVVAHSFGAAATAGALHLGLAADRVALVSGPASLASFAERWGVEHGLSEGDIPAFIRLIEREVGEPIEDVDVARLALGLTTPALIVHDRDDREIPVGGALAVAAAWAGSRTLITERYGHRRILVARPVVAAVVEFLSGR